MSNEEIINLLSLIDKADDAQKETLLDRYTTDIANSFRRIPYTQREEIITMYNGLLFDMGIITRYKLTDEEREKRRQVAANKPKFSETEEIIRQIFMKIFNEEPYWLKSSKAFSRFSKKGIKLIPPQRDSNLEIGYLDCRSKGYSICLNSGLPFFYIYIGENIEDVFLYMQKLEETDIESATLNNKALLFLIEIQKRFAKRTPDAIYVSSSYNNPNSSLVWMETSSSFYDLILSTERATSGNSNIVSLSDIAISSLQNNIFFHATQKSLEERFLQNGNDATIKTLNDIRSTFDLELAKNKAQKLELVKDE